MTTFKDAYATLQKHAQTLRAQQEPDIDNLTTIVTESVEAYKVCKERIDAVEKALEEALGNGETDARASAPQGLVSSLSGSSPRSADSEDDDVPF